MKKIFLVLLGAMMFCAGEALELREAEPVVVYYSPKTSIHLDFTYTETTETAGEYAAYAEELLGIEDAITESRTTYHFEGVEIKTRTTADTERPHVIKAEKGMPWQFVKINDKGLLVAYNAQCEKPANAQSEKTAGAQSDRRGGMKVIPYTEEIVEANSKEARAQAIAKQIFHLRETRMYLLNGEVEHAPADGKAMELVLKEIAREERQLVSLFVGKVERRKVHKQVSYVPQGDNTKRWDEVLYFSEDNGFTNADNVDAERIRIHADFRHQTTKKEAPAPTKKDKNAVEPSQIVYNIPGHGQIEVYYKNELLRSREIPVAQFGVDVPLPKDLFMGSELPKILFSERTGNVISITK